DSPAARYWLGQALLGLKRPQEAVVEFRDALQKSPDNTLTRFGLANALLQSRQPREALIELRTIARAWERVPHHHLLLSRTQSARGAPDDAIKAARAAIDLAPQDARGYTALGTVYAAKGDLPAAQDPYAKAVEVDPNASYAHLALGNAYSL